MQETYISTTKIGFWGWSLISLWKGHKKVWRRPDLVSKEKYGIPDFWWKILEANKMNDVFDFKAGKTIILPESVYA